MNGLQKFTVSKSVLSMKFTLTSAMTAHRARETVEMLSRDTPDFIWPLQWPPNSPDLNPVHYAIWCTQERVYLTRIRDVHHFVERLVQEWSRYDHKIISAAVTQSRVRLRARVKADWGHFEDHLLNVNISMIVALLWQLMDDHTALFVIAERVVRVVTETCFWCVIENVW